MAVRAGVVHAECGGLVEEEAGALRDPGGDEHLCRDYVAWHLPVDGRHPSDMDVVDGWRPVVERYVQAA